MTARRRVPAVAASIVFALAVAPTPAAAHLVGVEFGAFYAGALHLTLAIEHMVGLLALGLVAAAQPREAARWMLLGLPVGLGLGLVLALLAPSDQPLDLMIALSLAAPGLIGAAALRAPSWALAALAAAVGAAHGYANGMATHEAPIDWPLFAAGVVTAGTVLGTLAIALAAAAADLARWAPLAQRVLSSWIAAAGATFLAVSAAG